MILRAILFVFLMTKLSETAASGFDAYSSCYRTSRKRQELPCDFGSQTWCTIPGNSYPWHAVRRFVYENQGLMRRMYGDERHISVLRAELESNDIEFFHGPTIKDEFRRRYSKDIDGTKEFVKMFINSEGRKFVDSGPGANAAKIEKIQKSIDEASNNVLYHNHIKSAKEEAAKSQTGNGLGNEKAVHKATTPSSAAETTFVEPNSNYKTTTTTTSAATGQTTTTTTADAGNATTYNGPSDPTTQPTEPGHLNLTTPAYLPDTQSGESFDYAFDTDEPPTTTTSSSTTTSTGPPDDPATTMDPYFGDVEEVIGEEEEIVEEVDDGEPEQQQQPEDDEGNVQKDKSDNYQDLGEGTDPTKKPETSREPVSPPQPSPMIRLKGINACPVKEEVVAPFWANNTRGEVLALLNLYPFEQYVHWEKCTYEHKQMFCREGCRCEQQYRLHRLLAYDPNNECRGIFSDWFRFPSCCVCKCYDLPMEFRLTSRSPRFQTYDMYGKEPLNRFKQHP